MSQTPHFSLEEVYVDSAHVTAISHDSIHLLVTGSIIVTLQWGSNSDVRPETVSEIDQTFPFTCDLTCPISNPVPDELEVVENSLLVDTGDWGLREKEY